MERVYCEGRGLRDGGNLIELEVSFIDESYQGMRVIHAVFYQDISWNRRRVGV